MQNKFFNSKLNTILLAILIILMIIALRWMYVNKGMYLPESKQVDIPIGDTKYEANPEELNRITYTYTNHGFSIELPKGFVPKEEQSEGGPGIMISLPNGNLNYWPDATWWEKYSLPQYKYLKDEKIGQTTFKVYLQEAESGEGYYPIYWFKQGNIGYEISDDTTNDIFLKSFKFIGWSSEDENQESFINQPGAVKSITGWILAVDLLTHNSKWIPGVDSTGPFFLNQNQKVRNLKVTSDTVIYPCQPGSQNISTYLDSIQKRINEYNKLSDYQKSGTYVAYYFDINGSTISGIHDQCLP